MSEIYEDHVSTGEKFCVRAKHRVKRCDSAARLLHGLNARSQRRLQRTDIEHDAARFASGEFLQNCIRDSKRRCDHDQILIESTFAPILNRGETFQVTRWIG